MRERKVANGYAFSADTEWQKEFEEAFQYDETPDQLTAIADIKTDMETPIPDGPPGLRRCRLRQDRSRDARRIQSDRRRKTSGGAGADDDSCVFSTSKRSRSDSPHFR